jgi:hypothetical protein
MGRCWTEVHVMSQLYMGMLREAQALQPSDMSAKLRLRLRTKTAGLSLGASRNRIAYTRSQ